MTVQQLSGLDASFLYMETSRTFGHVSSLSIYEHPRDADFDPFEALRNQVASRLHLIEPLRRRLVEVPFGLDRPYWVADPDFDLDFHVRHLGLAGPGTTEQLTEQVARIIARALDRTKPLWELYVIEGLDTGDFAVLTKIHHAAIDGASGVEMMSILLDHEPDSIQPEQPAESSKLDAIPSALELLGRASVNMARNPARATRITLRSLGELAKAARRVDLANTFDALQRRLRPRSDDQRDRPPLLPRISAPATPFNKAITAHRRFAIGSAPLDDVKAIKNRLGVSINDVVMAVCAGGLRRYLDKHGVLPTEPLVAMVPVSTRSGEEADKWTNRVSALLAALPTDVEDPVQRVLAMHETMNAAKQRFDLMPADLIMDFTQLAMPALATRAIRLVAATRIVDRVNPPMNLVISNVPGPRQPLYAAGARMKHYYPVSTITDGQGLNITVQSYTDTLDFGLVSCRELVPDVWDLLQFCLDEVQQLKDG
ncbi:MAG: diacylglycerol O-acyltransferase / wax synthase [Ilumatobacteraceae bacterium]|jgi:WS/DGAT/MGAT family acyltransferase